MKIIKQMAKVKCDLGNCKNNAEYSVVPDNVSAREYLNLCAECLEKMHKEMNAVLAPPSIPNIVAKGERLSKMSIEELTEIKRNNFITKVNCNMAASKAIVNGSDKKIGLNNDRDCLKIKSLDVRKKKS